MEEKTGARILIVDDDGGVRELLNLLLEDRGYELTSVDNATDALEHLRLHDVDLMLLDKNLPDMNGLDLLRRLTSIDRRPTVIVMSAHASFAAADEAMKLGVADFLVKPFEDISYVLERVQKALAG